MPRATVSDEVKRFDLKSCEGGWVDLKRLTYGQYLERRDMATKMTAVTGATRDIETEIKMMQEKTVQYEFKHCIIDHNLEDENSNILDMSSPLVIRMLDPRIGEEIAKLIDSLNQFEEDLKN